MRIDSSLREQWKPEGDGFVAEVPSGWMQGRTLYGGLTAAYAVALGQTQVSDERSLRGFTCQLIRPISPGMMRAECRVQREGKTLSFVEVDLLQDKLCSRFQLSFAVPRESNLTIEAREKITLPQADDLEELPYIEGIVPEFVQRIQMRWAEGMPPFFGGKEAEFTGACRFREPAGGIEGVVGLLDAWPCPSLSRLNTPAFASTATWSGQILSVPDRFDDWFAFHYRTEAGQDGFHTTRGELYGPDGELVALSEQLVVLFD